LQASDREVAVVEPNRGIRTGSDGQVGESRGLIPDTGTFFPIKRKSSKAWLR